MRDIGSASLGELLGRIFTQVSMTLNIFTIIASACEVLFYHLGVGGSWGLSIQASFGFGGSRKSVALRARVACFVLRKIAPIALLGCVSLKHRVRAEN